MFLKELEFYVNKIKLILTLTFVYLTFNLKTRVELVYLQNKYEQVQRNSLSNKQQILTDMKAVKLLSKNIKLTNLRQIFKIFPNPPFCGRGKYPHTLWLAPCFGVFSHFKYNLFTIRFQHWLDISTTICFIIKIPVKFVRSNCQN